MIKISELKEGDFVLVDYEGVIREGEVTGLNHDEKEIEVETSVQPFWYTEEHLHPIPLTDEQILKLHFTKHLNDDGSAKYMKGSFRLHLPKAGDFSHFEMWYREDRRHNPDVHFIHQLQNHFLDMTKMHLTKDKV